MSGNPERVRFQGFVAVVGRVIGCATGVAMAVSAGGVLLCLVLIGYSVVMRYAFRSAPVWVDEVVGFLLVGIVMLAAAQALRRDEHIAVDLLTARLGSRARLWVRAWASGAVAAVSAMLVVNGWETAMFARSLGIVTEGHVELPVYLLQLLLPFGGAMMLLVALESLGRIAAGASPPAGSSHAEEHAA